MELFTPAFFSALLAIVVIDLVLAGDNAIVIALAARSLPAHLRKKAIIWGSVGAVAIRSLMTVAVVWLLKIPGLLAIGGIALLWIAYKLLHSSGDESSHINPATSFFGAMRTIVIADAVMGIDNVLAVAGAAHGSYLLVVLGLLISIPIVVWGSTLLLNLTQRFPIIIYLGAAVLVITGVKMTLSEPLLKPWLDGHSILGYAAYLLALVVVLFSGYVRNQLVRMRAAVRTHAKVRLDYRRNNSLGDTSMEKLLIPVDGSENSLAAVRQVIADTRSGDQREIMLLNVQPLLSRHAARFLSKSSRDGYRRAQADRALEAPEKLLRSAGLSNITRHSRNGPAAEQISQFATEHGCRRIVIGTARKNTLSRLVENSVTARLLETSPVPVQIVMGRHIGALERVGIPAGVGAALAALVFAVD